MSEVLYRKWRPQALAEVVGQEAVTKTLGNALASGKVAHAYLFAGPRGTGKTSTARILARAVNCLREDGQKPCQECPMCRAFAQGQALDLIEIDAASNRGIDEIRDLREKVNFAPNLARYKVYIIDEAHQLTADAFSALLKTLEEPPPHAIFVLATTEPHRVPLTILSRCQRFDFRRISSSAMVARLEQICTGEGIRAEAEALALIARAAGGSLRDALNLLEKAVTYYGSDIGLRQVQEALGLVDSARLRELASHLLGRNLAAGLAAISDAGNNGVDLRQLQRGLMDYLRNVLLVKAGAGDGVDVGPEDKAELIKLAATTSAEEVMRALRLLSQEVRVEGQPALSLELALAELCLSREEPSPPPSQPRVTAPRAEANFPRSNPLPRPAPAPPQPRPAPKVEAPRAEAPKPAPRERGPMPIEPAARLEFLRANWRRLLGEAPPPLRSSNGVAFLRSSQPVSLENNIVVIEFRHEFHCRELEKAENKHQAEEFLSQLLGSPCRLRCVVSQALTQAASDPLVQEAMRWGGRIVNVETEGHVDE
ncbi:MAG: DNA polymerase III subunit gamma/tau [Chloroflexi bacterium]|nr:DNA polymerase III subunit gamma/tau [Chloroflexota bacterium]